MRAIAWDRVLAATEQAFVSQGGSPQRPIVDGYALPDLPVNLFKAGKQNDVAIYVSSTAKDLGSSPQFFEVKTLAELQKLAKEAFGDYTDEFFKLFPASNDAEAVKQAQAVVAGNGFGIANRDWARAQALTGKQPSYLAQFARVQPFAPDVKWISFNPAAAGAAHASDIQYWLGTYGIHSDTRNWTAWDRELSDKMQDTLVAFAKTGNPSTIAVQIPRYDPNDEQRIVFGDKIWVEKLSTAQLEFLRAHPTARPRPGGR
jgi:para-nitrobenzyl esterase